MSAETRVGVIGDFSAGNVTHRATNEALGHAANALGVTVDVQWVPTPELDGAPAEMVLGGFHGLWCAPGSPYQSLRGALEGIRFARERGRPFFGT